MFEELKTGPIKGPHIRQSLLLGVWQIRTGEYADKDGWISARHTYPIEKEILEQIALDWIVKQMEGYEKGFSIDLYGKKRDGKREKFILSVERNGFEQETKTGDATISKMD